MLNRWAGPLVTGLIVIGVGLILLLNLNPSRAVKLDVAQGSDVKVTVNGIGISGPENRSTVVEPSGVLKQKPANFREYPIGDEALRNHIRVAAVWLPPVQMDGMSTMGADVIHLEADVRATEGNPNGFAKDEFVPYLEVHYTIVPSGGGAPIHEGKLLPMVANDGLHYGASIAMPKAGDYRLTYAIQPPSAGGLGRHSDPVTGVAPWWGPFEVSFDWEYPGLKN